MQNLPERWGNDQCVDKGKQIDFSIKLQAVRGMDEKNQ